MKIFFEFAPLLLFFLAFKAMGDILFAIAVLIWATLLALAGLWLKTRKISWVSVATAVLVGGFGGAALFFQDENLFKLKPTVINIIFAAILLGSAYFKKPLLKKIMGEAMIMKDSAWCQLAVRYGSFFLVLALANEIIWRNFSTNIWVMFKAFGFLGATVIFALAQIPFMQKNALIDDKHKDK